MACCSNHAAHFHFILIWGFLLHWQPSSPAAPLLPPAGEGPRHGWHGRCEPRQEEEVACCPHDPALTALPAPRPPASATAAAGLLHPVGRAELQAGEEGRPGSYGWCFPPLSCLLLPLGSPPPPALTSIPCIEEQSCCSIEGAVMSALVSLDRGLKSAHSPLGILCCSPTAWPNWALVLAASLAGDV